MKKIRYYLEYVVLSLLGAVLRLLPRSAVLWLGKRAGDFIFYCVPVRRAITMEQLKTSFPEKDGGEIRRIGRQAYQNLAMNGLEHLCFQGLSKKQLHEIVEFEGEDVVSHAYSKGRGVIYVGGHFGNWEYMGGALSAKGYPLTYVVAGIANPHLDKIVNRHRRDMGIKILPKGVTVRGILKTLRNNGGMALLMDQDAGRNGIFIDYFGRPCSTPKGPALFALKTGASMVFVSAIRTSAGKIRAVFEPVDIDYSLGVTDENIYDIMQRCTARLEGYVRKYPGQWFWMHRRWKTTPEIAARSHGE